MMKLTRRDTMLWPTAALVSAVSSSRVFSQSVDIDQALRDAIQSSSELTLGRIIPPPDDISWRETRRILDSAPSQKTPIEVAEYFVSGVPVKYQSAWPEPNPKNPTYANPVIVSFFLATRTKPEGDTTAWCAAFLNWCLNRSGLPQTGSAAAISFLKWGESVWDKAKGGVPTMARRGDIAVFRNKRDPVHGHVAFFVGVSKKHAQRIDVLGGNHILRSGSERIHLIDFRPMRVDTELELVDVRTMNGLRPA